jgi:hypothetical protein
MHYFNFSKSEGVISSNKKIIGRYCRSHFLKICNIDNIKYRYIDSIEYTYNNNKCNVPDCNKNSYSNSYFCIDHKCSLNKCNKIKRNGLDYCNGHICKEKTCCEIIKIGNIYCEKHKCTIHNCNNLITKNKACSGHICTYTDCDNIVNKINTHCDSNKHNCEYVICNNLKLSGSNFCEIHDCSSLSCKYNSKNNNSDLVCDNHLFHDFFLKEFNLNNSVSDYKIKFDDNIYECSVCLDGYKLKDMNVCLAATDDPLYFLLCFVVISFSSFI